MGIFGALNAAVTGMRAQSFALENVSGNIANAQTTGFKRLDTSFVDLIPDNILLKQVSGSVMANSRATNTVPGDIENASIGTFMAINGDGFFVVQKPGNRVDNQQIFTGIENYTRRGDFQVNKDGYLVNGAGYYLMGIPVNATTGNPIGSTPQVLRFQNDFLPAQATTQIDYRANLARIPQTANYDPAIPGSELLDTTLLQTGSGDITAANQSLFVSGSISGGAITAYDESGASTNIRLRWAKIDSADSGTADIWNLFYQSNASAANDEISWRNAGTEYRFVDGKMDPPLASLSLADVVVDGISLGTIQLNHGAGGITQFSDDNGVAKVNLLAQNGYAAGELQSVSVSDEGRIIGNYSNGRTIDLAEIVLASFNGTNFLKRIDGGAFEVTAESGGPIYGAAGKIVGSSLEGSNTDIADEFTKLIITQQAYSSNTRVVTTANQMVQDLLNMLR